MDNIEIIAIGVGVATAISLLWQWWKRRRRARWQTFLDRLAPSVDGRTEREDGDRALALVLAHAGHEARLVFRESLELVLTMVLLGDLDPGVSSFHTAFEWRLPGAVPAWSLRVRAAGLLSAFSSGVIATGDAAFDEKFTATSSDEARARGFLTPPVREAIRRLGSARSLRLPLSQELPASDGDIQVHVEDGSVCVRRPGWLNTEAGIRDFVADCRQLCDAYRDRPET